MKISLCILIANLVAWQLRSQQSTLYGVVSVLNSQAETGKREYVHFASVEEEFGRAQQTLTDSEGKFRLVLIKVEGLENVQFMVAKKGLDVVNADALHAVANQREQIAIYMAAPGKIADYRKKYYNIGKTAAEKALETKLATLQSERNRLKNDAGAHEKRIGELETQLAEMEAQRLKLDAAARELARRYAPVNLDDTSPAFREAFAFFQQGELDKALDILQRADYAAQARNILLERDSIAAGMRRMEQRDSIQRQRAQDAIRGLSLQADLYKTNLTFDSVAQCFEIMLRLDSGNVQILRQYAFFLAEQNHYEKAAVCLSQALRRVRSEETKAVLLNNLGNACRALQRMDEAEAAYREALAIFRKLSERQPEEYLPAVALTLNNLGNFYRKVKMPDSDRTRNPEAQEAFLEALRIYNGLAQKHPDEFQPYLALTHNNLGRVYYENGKMARAKSAFEDALDIYEKLAGQNPGAIIPGDIREFVDLNLAYDDHNKAASLFDRYSENLLQRALAVHLKLAEKNPAVFRPFAALTLSNLGNLYMRHGKGSKAETAYQDALKIQRELAETNPAAFAPFLAITLRHLAGFYTEMRKYPEAQAAANEAEAIERKYDRN